MYEAESSWIWSQSAIGRCDSWEAAKDCVVSRTTYSKPCNNGGALQLSYCLTFLMISYLCRGSPPPEKSISSSDNYIVFKDHPRSTSANQVDLGSHNSQGDHLPLSSKLHQRHSCHACLDSGLDIMGNGSASPFSSQTSPLSVRKRMNLSSLE